MNKPDFEQMKVQLLKLYSIKIDEMTLSEMGTGSLTFFVKAGENKYVVKYIDNNEMNHPEIEPRICEILLKNEIPVSEFIRNINGNILSEDSDGNRYHIQKFIEGRIYGYHDAPKACQEEAARMLARIHVALKDADNIPDGIGADFFHYRTPEGTLDTYKNSLRITDQKGDLDIAERIRCNMNVISHMPKYQFDLTRLSCGNTHGDYTISQLLWKQHKISGIIDWTSTCKHPYVWEIMRSYIFMAPECRDGQIDMDGLANYIKAYISVNQLNAYDLENAGPIFYYFLAVCDFYGQFYQAATANRNIYLEQANLSSKLLVWFEQNISKLTDKLVHI